MREHKPQATQRHIFFFVARIMIVGFLVLIAYITLLPTNQVRAQPARSNAGSGTMYTVVYDVTRGRYSSYGVPGQFVAASSMKVPILLTFLNMIERQGRAATSSERGWMITMIENSNNDSATALYNEVGRGAGVVNYIQRIGLSGLSINPKAWGWSLISPWTMLNLLTLLNAGAILTPQDRIFALTLLQNVEADQRVGVGDTAPAGALVAMKDGWVIGPDGLWAVNSSGIVRRGAETYIIAAYTRGEPSLGAGQSAVRQICAAVAANLG